MCNGNTCSDELWRKSLGTACPDGETCEYELYREGDGLVRFVPKTTPTRGQRIRAWFKRNLFADQACSTGKCPVPRRSSDYERDSWRGYR